MKLKIIALASLLSASLFAEPVFIVNKGVALDSTMATKIFEGKISSLPDGSQFTLGTLSFSSDEAGDGFKALLGKSSNRIKNIWTKKQFSGKGTVPKEFQTAAELVEWVSKTQGAIAIVDSEKVNASVNTL